MGLKGDAVVGYVLSWFFVIYEWVLIVRALGSWVLLANQGRMPGALDGIWRAIMALTEPPLRVLRRFIPSPSVGGVGLDLSFLVLFLAVGVLQRIAVSLPF